MTTKENLIESLKQFTGSFQYYPSTFKSLKLTEGMHFLRETAQCYWLIDIVESVQHLPKVKEYKNFIVWRIVKTGDTAVVTGHWDCEEDLTYSDKKKVYEQKLTYTDFPLDEFHFYQEGDVLLLTTEH